MDLDTVLSKNPNSAYRFYDGKGVVVLPDRSEVNVLNEVGSMVWEQIDGKRNVAQILRAVVDTFEINPDQVEQDVIAFITSLQEHGMVS